MWHGPSVLEALESVTAVQASAVPAVGSHSIWALVLHIAVWAEVPLRRLNNEPAKDLTESDDFPPLPAEPSEAEWDLAKRRMVNAYATLAETVAMLSPDELDEIVVEQQYSARTMLNGVIEHGVYHAGQIMLLRRALEEATR